MTNNTKYIINIGFSSIVILIILLGGANIYQLYKANKRLADIVELNDVKIDLATNMRESIRLRQVSINSMLVIDDPFELDNELMRFYSYAGPYRESRETLLSMPMDDYEKTLQTRLTSLVRVAQPLNKNAAELLVEGAPISEIKKAILSARKERLNLLSTLDELVKYQKEQAKNAVQSSREKFNRTVVVMILLGVLVIALTGAIGRFISRYVSKKNAELESKNTELAIAYERAEEATTTKSAFLATMSHEIRTPLTAIIGFSEIAMEGMHSKLERDNLLKSTIRCGKHLLNVINDILDISKVEAGKLEVEQMVMSPFQLVTDIESLIQSQAHEKGLVEEWVFRCCLP